MKKSMALIVFVFLSVFLRSQENNTPASQLAHHIADKMKDTLGLNNQQRARVFQINMDLYKQKTLARGESQDRIVVGKDLQRIEGTRDSLYSAVLTEAQYNLYVQKKRYLVTNN